MTLLLWVGLAVLAVVAVVLKTVEARGLGVRPARVPRGRFLALRVWWRTWGQLVMGLGLLVVAVVVVVVAFQVKDIEQQTAKQRSATAIAARQSCIRARQIGYRLIDFYHYGTYTLPNGTTHHPLTAKQAADYRKLIPKTCPGK